MRLRNVKGALEHIEKSKYVIHDYKKYTGKFNLIFNNNNPICIEIGIGKGKFIYELAKKNPNINYIGIEKYDSVLIRALEKQESEELNNLRFIKMDATEIENVFDKEIETLYLNFSDPWPKLRHEDRRLTSKRFLSRYEGMFKDENHIEFKTDNRHLFEFSVISLTNYGYKINEIILNLYDEDIKDNISTEYEEKFNKKGMPIYKIDVTK